MAALSGRENIVVIADEAHRSHYDFGGRVKEKGEMSYGFASNLHQHKGITGDPRPPAGPV